MVGLLPAVAQLLIWQETECAITSVDFARQKGLWQALESVAWELVVADEAHKPAAYRRPNDTIRETQAYELDETLTRHTIHFLLMTATPHKGDPDNDRLLIRLIDPQWSDAATCTGGAHPLVLRHTKEEIRKADGSPLYAERLVEPHYYNSANSANAPDNQQNRGFQALTFIPLHAVEKCLYLT